MLEKYLLVMLGMKKPGKSVSYEHIREKVLRDFGSDEELRKTLDSLVDKGLIVYDGTNYSANQKTIEAAKKVVLDVREINEVYVAKFIASKIYFPEVAHYMLGFLKDDKVGVYRKFTDKCFFQMKLGKKPIVISNEQDILELVEMHAFDFFVKSSRFTVEKGVKTGLLIFDGDDYFTWKPGFSKTFFRAPFSINHENYRLALPVREGETTPTIYDVSEYNIHSLMKKSTDLIRENLGDFFFQFL